MKKITIVYKRPDKIPEVIQIDNTLEEFRRLLDGGYLEAVRAVRDVHAYVDEEGRLKDLPINFMLRGEPIVGPAIFSKVDEEGEDTGFDTEEEAREFMINFDW